MGYIRFDIISDRTDENNARLHVDISRLRSDITSNSLYELNLILHALALKETVREIRSCYGAGYWRGDKPWLGSDVWKG